MPSELHILVVVILLVLIYVAQKTAFLVKRQADTEAFLESQLREIKASQELIPSAPLAYGWFDNGWPLKKDEKNRTPLENPSPQNDPDDYAIQMYISEYKSMPSAHQRKEFLRRLLKEGVWMKPEMLDVVYADENDYVRAWAAGHLDTKAKDYTNVTSIADRPREVRDYESVLRQDPEPIVRAALLSNPKCDKSPWSLIWVSEGWKEQMQCMSQLERLGLMRNPELSSRYVLALLEAPSLELNMSRMEHAEVLSAAVVNPNLISGSRRTGREFWIGGGEGYQPVEEYGSMWKACLEKWMDEPRVPHMFIKYIQTSAEVKVATYKRLLGSSNSKWLRHEVIASCDPFIDKQVLKLAWDDPDEECRKITRERVGRFTKIVGVKERRKS